MADDETPLMVEIVYALPGEQVVLTLEVKPGTKVWEAIEQSGIRRRFPHIDAAHGRVGIFGKVVKADTALKHGDRVEIYRALIADPKAARRQRARRTR